MQDQIEIYLDAQRRFRWRRTDAHGEQIGSSSRAFRCKRTCRENLERVMNAEGDLKFLTDKRGKSRWKRVDGDGQTFAASSRGFGTEREAVENAARVCSRAARINGCGTPEDGRD